MRTKPHRLGEMTIGQGNRPARLNRQSVDLEIPSKSQTDLASRSPSRGTVCSRPGSVFIVLLNWHNKIDFSSSVPVNQPLD